MSERIPQPLSESERAPATYERALDAVRLLKASGVENPFDDEDERVIQTLAPLEEWYRERNLHMRGVGSVEKAADLIRAARIFIDAGYDAERFYKAAQEKLNDEHADALREEGNEEAVRLLRNALDAIEAVLGTRDPKERVPAIVAAKLTEATRLAEQGKKADAVGILSLALIDPRFKRLSPDILAKVKELRDTIKAR